MLIKLGGGITAMSGSLAGNTFARNRFGNYARPRTKPVNPNSAYQVVIRTAMAFFTQRWHNTLTPTMRSQWATYAAAVASKNRLGESVYLTGFNWYLAVNIFRSQNGNSKCDSGPTELTMVESDPLFSVVAYASTQKIHVTRDTTLPWCQIAASIMGIYQGVPQGTTRNFFNGPWRNVGPIPGNGVSPTIMTAPFALVTGQKVWVYGRIATGPTDARIGPPIVAACTVAAAPP